MNKFNSLASLLGIACFGFMLLVFSGIPETCACNKKSIQLLLQPKTPELTEVTQSVLHLLSRQLSGQHLEVGVLEQANVAIYYSKPANRSIINEIWREIDTNPETPELEVIPSDESNLVEIFQQFSDRVSEMKEGDSLVSFIVTEGTDDRDIVAKIHYLMDKIAESPSVTEARLYVIGVKAQNRLIFSEAFQPIGDFVEFSSPNYQEYTTLIQRIK